MTSVSIVIAFRDRGRDPLRQLNLRRILDHWAGFEVLLVDDGRDGDQQFSRSAAYNRALALAKTDILAYCESDMLVDYDQLLKAVELAKAAPGLVVPYSLYCYLSEADSEKVRDGADPRRFAPEFTIPNARRSWPRTGPLNVVSRTTLEMTGGWDETFEGSHFDDRAMNRAFEVCCGPTRFVEGPSFHLYHKPAHTGPHLTGADRAATAANRRRFRLYQRARSADEIRELTMGQR